MSTLRSPLLTPLSTTDLELFLAPSGPQFLSSKQWVRLLQPLLAQCPSQGSKEEQQQGPPCPSEAGWGSSTCCHPPSPP